MKAWRKHNALMAAKIKELKEELDYTFNDTERPVLEEKIKSLQGLRLRTKIERRGQFAAEVAIPSQLVYILFARVGLPVPPEFIDYVRSRSAASNPST